MSNVYPLHGTAQAPTAPVRTPAPLPLTFYNECRNLAPKKWIIKGVIAKGESSSWYGAPGSMKSALKTDIAFHVAAKRDWRGYRCRAKCGVVYFAFERADLVRRRLAAYAVRDGSVDLPIAVSDKIIDMVNPACVDIIVDTVRAAEARFGCSAGLIILDTWSKGIAAGGGDEDKAREQNFVAANLKRIHEQLSVHIAGIGHSGKDESRGERGSNARQGDVDLQVHINGGLVKTATIVKANDQPDGVLTSFGMDTVTLGTDEDGEPITTGILSDRTFVATASASKLSPRHLLALGALTKSIEAHGQDVPAEGGAAVRAVAGQHWRDELFRCGVLDREAKNPRSEFKRMRTALTVAGRIVERDGMVWTTDSPLPPLPGQFPGVAP